MTEDTAPGIDPPTTGGEPSVGRLRRRAAAIALILLFVVSLVGIVAARELGCLGCTGGDWTAGEVSDPQRSGLLSDLRSLRSAQEEYFDSGEYRYASLEELERSSHRPSQDVEVRVDVSESGFGYRAAAWIPLIDDEPCLLVVGEFPPAAEGAAEGAPAVSSRLREAAEAEPGRVRCEEDFLGRSAMERARIVGRAGVGGGLLLSVVSLVLLVRVLRR